MTDCYTLAHLSDPHLTTLAGVRPWILLNKRLLGYWSWRRSRRRLHRADILNRLVHDVHDMNPDHVAVTGDFVHIAAESEFSQTADWLSRLGPSRQVSIVPGNHDAYVRVDEDRGLGRWRTYTTGDDGGADFPYLRRRGPFSLIGVTSARPSAPLLATGRLGARQRNRLAELLDAEAGRIRTLLIHHPPLPGMVGRRKALTDAAALKQLLTTHGIELILHGHTHKASRGTLTLDDGRQAMVLGAPSASAAGPAPERRAGYYLIRACTGERGWSLEYEYRQYQCQQRCFIRQDARRNQ